MTQASGKNFAVGMRYGVAFALNSAGLPAATATTAYEGLEFVGPKAFSLNAPEPRRIDHQGADRVLAVDYLPPLESMSGQLNVSKVDLDLNAALLGVNVFDVGEMDMIAWQSDQQGSEPQVGLLLFQQALDAVTKVRTWRFYLMPSARCIPRPGSFDENAAEISYMVAPSPVTNHLWGTALATATEGALEAAVIEGHSESKPKIVAFLGDGTEDEFLFPLAAQAASTDKITVWVNGTLQTTGITKTTDKVTFTTPPALNDLVVVFYEYD